MLDNSAKFNWKLVFWIVFLILIVLFALLFWLYYYKGTIPGTTIYRATPDAFVVDPRAPLSIREDGYSYGYGTVTGRDGQIVFLRFNGGEEKQIFFAGFENHKLFVNDREIFGKNKLEKWNDLKNGDVVSVVFNSEGVAGFVRIISENGN
jgi:hypothetical protein